jgi:Fungal specific transcription factor domain
MVQSLSLLTSTGATSNYAFASILCRTATLLGRPVSLNALLQAPNTSRLPTEEYTPLKGHTPLIPDSNLKHFRDRHLANYFAKVHNLIPVLHECSFRALYENFWSPRTESNLRKITSPLVYSVLALGALYDDGHHILYAKDWVGKARKGLDHAAGECGFEICLAEFFLVHISLP